MYNSNDIIKQLIKDRANFLKENQKNIEKKNNDYCLFTSIIESINAIKRILKIKMSKEMVLIQLFII